MDLIVLTSKIYMKKENNDYFKAIQKFIHQCNTLSLTNFNCFLVKTNKTKMFNRDTSYKKLQYLLSSGSVC